MNALERIRQLMEERGWSDYRLSKESGVFQSTISNLFKRNNLPTLPTLEAICGAFGITLAQFFSEEGEPIVLTKEQKTLLSKWAALSERQKNILLDIISNMPRRT